MKNLAGWTILLIIAFALTVVPFLMLSNMLTAARNNYFSPF